MQVKKTSKQFKRPRLITERKRLSKKRAPSFSPIDICGTLARLQEKHTIVQKEHKEGKELDFDNFAPALKLLKGILFKADVPYRTRLPLTGVTATSSSGILNATISCSSVVNVAEWSSIDALFDEFFIHSITYCHRPQNDNGAGIGVTSTGLAPTVSSTTTYVANCSVAAVSIFNGAAAYSSNPAMMANATVAMHPSGKIWKYVWRNSQRFDRRGDNASASGWQGWTLIGNATNYGGQIQIRALNDTVFGSGSASVTLGNYVAFWDVSFRARS